MSFLLSGFPFYVALLMHLSTNYAASQPQPSQDKIARNGNSPHRASKIQTYDWLIYGWTGLHSKS